MNIVNTLTLRHIKTHKKRTVLTIMAIIVSVAMVTAVFTSAVTLVNFFKEVTIAMDGDYHVTFNTKDWDRDKEQFELEGDFIAWSPYSLYGSDTESDMFILAVRGDYTSLANIEVSEGYFPANENEILLTRERLEKNFKGKRAGDTIEIIMGVPDGSRTEKRSFRISGITDSKSSAAYSYTAYTFATDEFLSSLEDIPVRVRYRELNRGIFDKIAEFASGLEGGDAYNLNDELLAYNGIAANDNLIPSLAAFSAILLLIIAVVSVFMIYDSFAVSYQERSKYLGILASVGATKAQKRSSLYFEAFILGLIGIPLGILSGIGGIAITFRALSDNIINTMADGYAQASHGYTLHIHINWIVIVGTIIASAITLLISAYIPARKASKTNPVEAIKQSGVTKVKKPRRLRVSKLTQKLLGFSGVMAVKNYRRNSKRSRNIVFALFLSVVVFLAATNFSSMFTTLMTSEFATGADVKIESSSDWVTDIEKILNKREDIRSYYKCSYIYGLFESKFLSEEKEYPDIAVVFLDNDALDDYARQTGVKPEKLHGDGINGILCNLSYTFDNGKKVISRPVKNIKNTKMNVEFNLTTDEERPETVNTNINVIDTVNEYWNEPTFPLAYISMPVMVLSYDLLDDVLQKDTSAHSVYAQHIEYRLFTDNGNLGSELEEILVEKGVGFAIYENSVELEAINNLLTIAKVFAYGFIVLITLISVMNIINTIFNSMNERRREFAMLRSVGMTGKEFSKMIYLESFRYGFIALLFGLPASVIIHYLEYKALSGSFDFGFSLNPMPYIFASVSVFAVIAIALLYSGSKIKEDNIIETLRQE